MTIVPRIGLLLVPLTLILGCVGTRTPPGSGPPHLASPAMPIRAARCGANTLSCFAAT